MALGAVNLMLWAGPTIPRPLPQLSENVDRVEVSQTDEGRSGFQIVVKVGRNRQALFSSYRLVDHPALKPDNRVVVVIWVNSRPTVLIDGLIRHQQLKPGNEPGTSTFTITGEDISAELDREEITVEHPAQNELIIALKLIGKYARYGLVPVVIPPFMVDFPNPVERIPVQRGTDLDYLHTIAGRFGYVFYIKPGPAPLVNTAYWGPPLRLGRPATTLVTNSDHLTNVEQLDFQYDAETATAVTGRVKDRSLNIDLPLRTFATTRLPLATQINPLRTTQIDQVEGLTYPQAFARAQAKSNKTSDNALTVTGELDTERYGDILQARGLVGLSGAGNEYNGLYYIKQVTHVITPGEYKQRFTLTREGLGSTLG